MKNKICFLIICILLLSMVTAFEYTHDDGIKYITQGNGNMKVLDIAGYPASDFGFGFEAFANNKSMLFVDTDFNWSWSENIDGRTRNYTAQNNDKKLIWKQEYIFTPNEPVKIKHTINNKHSIFTSTKFWIYQEVENKKAIYFNDQKLTADRDSPTLISANLATAPRKFQIGGAYTFMYQDLIDSEFTLTDLDIGNGSVIGKPEKTIIALGFTKNFGVWSSNTEMVIDPQVTGWKFPTSIGTTQWADSSNIISDNSIPAQEDTIGHIMESYGYSFEIANGSTIQGIYVKAECRAGGLALPAKSKAFLGINLSWDAGNTYTSIIKNSWTWGVGTSYEVKYYGSYTNNWGRTWLVNETSSSNFYTKIQYTNGLANFNESPGFGTDGGCDYVAVDINYTAPQPYITFVNPTPVNGTIGTSMIANYTSNVSLTECRVTENSTGTWNGQNISVYDDGMGCQGCVAFKNNTPNTKVRFWATAGTVDNEITYREYTINNTYAPQGCVCSPQAFTYDHPYSEELTINITIDDLDGQSTDYMDYELLIDPMNDFKNYKKGNRTCLENNTYSMDFKYDHTSYNSTGLYAYYRFNNDSDIGENGSYIVDTAGNYNGTITNPGEHIEGFFGNGYEFNNPAANPDDFIILDNESGFSEFSEGIAISVWYYPTESGGDIIGKSDTTGNNKFFELSYLGGIIRWEVSEDGQTSNECESFKSAAITDNVWHHIVATLEIPDNVSRIYVNGTEVDSTACGNFVINPVNWSDHEHTLIGATDYSNDDTATNPLDGRIDNVMIWNRTMYSTEVQNLYKLQNQTYYHWNLTLKDYSLNLTDNLTHVVANTFINDTGWFMLGDPCLYDGSGNYNINCTRCGTITANYDLGENDMIVSDSDEVNINANITGIDKIIGTGCKIALLNGNYLT